jgi:hypothetical protein
MSSSRRNPASRVHRLGAVVILALAVASAVYADTTYYYIGAYNDTASDPPFAGGADNSTRCQLLIMRSEVARRGRIASFAMQAFTNFDSERFDSLRILVCPTPIENVTSNFQDNYGGNTPTTILSVPSRYMTAQRQQWNVFDATVPFYYGDSQNLLVEIKWLGDDDRDAPHAIGGGITGNRMLLAPADTATTGTIERFMRTRIGITDRYLGSLLAPNGNEFWAGGDTQMITWSIDPKDYFYTRLLLSTDGGVTYPTVIAQSLTPTDTVYGWAVPELNNASCRVKVQAYDSTDSLVFEDPSNTNFTIDSQNPLAPDLVFPPNGGAVNVQTVVFRWHRAPDNLAGIGYHTIQIAYDSMFGALVDTARRTDTTYARLLPADTSFYWRVRGTDRSGNVGPWSQKWKFEIDMQTPEVPTLLEPMVGQWLRSSTAQFHWTPVSFRAPVLSAVRYILQLDTIQSIRPLYTDTATAVYDTFGSLPEHRYWWRVRAYDLAGNQGTFSTIRGFGIDTTGPVIPNLIYPPHLGSIATDTTSLIWHASLDNLSGTEVYHVQLARDGSFADTIALPAGPTMPDTAVVASLPGMMNYYWHVRARDTAGNWCSWSPVRQFTYGVGVAEQPDRLPSVAHVECQPNPSGGQTMVRLALPSSTHASVVVYNAAGMKVGVLWNGRLPAGQHRFDWSAEAHAGRAVGPGVYYIRATAGQWTRVTSVRVVR